MFNQSLAVRVLGGTAVRELAQGRTCGERRVPPLSRGRGRAGCAAQLLRQPLGASAGSSYRAWGSCTAGCCSPAAARALDVVCGGRGLGHCPVVWCVPGESRVARSPGPLHVQGTSSGFLALRTKARKRTGVSQLWEGGPGNWAFVC